MNMNKLNIINITHCNDCPFAIIYDDDVICNYQLFLNIRSKEYNSRLKFPNHEGDVIHEKCPIKNMKKIILNIGSDTELTDEEIASY
jgi:hypothetical protein